MTDASDAFPLPTCRFQLVIALAAVVIAAALIKKDVTDSAHQQEAFAIVEQMKSEAKTYAEKRNHAMDDLTKLLARRTTPMSDVERAGQRVIGDDRAYAEKLVDVRSRLKSVLTASEWAEVCPVRAQLRLDMHASAVL